MRRRLLTALVSAAAIWLAAPVQASSIAYQQNQTLIGAGPQAFNDQFTLAAGLPAGKYKATLEDKKFLDPFQLLALVVDSAAPGTLVDLRAPGMSGQFDLTHGVTYFVGVVGTPGGLPPTQVSRFAVTISHVPLPASVVLLGSALAGLVVVRRRRTLEAAP